MHFDEFVNHATNAALNADRTTRDTAEWRRTLAGRFAGIHAAVPCEHSAGEAYVLADAVLRLQVPGPVVECGCFRGGMTAKLSLVCAATGRRLIVFDSFIGLPQPVIAGGRYHFYASREDVRGCYGTTCQFARGQYAASRDEVAGNVEMLGAIAVCRFVSGWFAETLPRSDVRPALVMLDVDLVESARDCLRTLWPRLTGDKLFTHEAFNETYMKGLLDAAWWQDAVGCPPPAVVGAGTGLGPTAGCLAYLIKRELLRERQ